MRRSAVTKQETTADKHGIDLGDPGVFASFVSDVARTGGPILLVADSGGHLQELWELATLIPSSITKMWVTSDTSMSRSLLVDEPHAEFSTSRVYPRRLDLALRTIPPAVSWLRRHRPCLVISTGPAIAAPWVAAARALRIPAMFVESATFLSGRSLTGRIMERIPGVLRLSQTGLVSRRWGSAPNVFDLAAARAVQPTAGGAGQLAFVTIGSNKYSFDRLVRKVDELLPADWDVVWQLGDHPGYRPARGRVETLIPFDDVVDLMRRSDVIISHAGVGSILTALALGRVPIVCARSASEHEHVDDHQNDLVSRLAELPNVLVHSVDDLSYDAILDARNRFRESS